MYCKSELLIQKHSCTQSSDLDYLRLLEEQLVQFKVLIYGGYVSRPAMKYDVQTLVRAGVILKRKQSSDKVETPVSFYLLYDNRKM